MEAVLRTSAGGPSTAPGAAARSSAAVTGGDLRSGRKPQGRPGDRQGLHAPLPPARPPPARRWDPAPANQEDPRFGHRQRDAGLIAVTWERLHSERLQVFLWHGPFVCKLHTAVFPGTSGGRRGCHGPVLPHQTAPPDRPHAFVLSLEDTESRQLETEDGLFFFFLNPRQRERMETRGSEVSVQ